MDQAIGQKIADYLIKPVNPNQILLALKKNIHKKQIVTEVTQTGYRKDFKTLQCASWTVALWTTGRTYTAALCVGNLNSALPIRI